MRATRAAIAAQAGRQAGRQVDPERVVFFPGHPPEGGMFVTVGVRATGLGGEAFALRLLEEEDVAVTPLDGFGPSGAGHVRIDLGADEELLAEAARPIARLAARVMASR